MTSGWLTLNGQQLTAIRSWCTAVYQLHAVVVNETTHQLVLWPEGFGIVCGCMHAVVHGWAYACAGSIPCHCSHSTCTVPRLYHVTRPHHVNAVKGFPLYVHEGRVVRDREMLASSTCNIPTHWSFPILQGPLCMAHCPLASARCLMTHVKALQYPLHFTLGPMHDASL